ncbi:MAG: hypothetical protein AAF408_10445 [Pseudomonadota bacterium]
MKKSIHSKEFEKRLDTSGRNQDASKRDAKKAKQWAKSTQSACKAVVALAAAMEATAVAAGVTDSHFANIVTKMIALEDKIEPLEKSKDRDDQKEVKKLLGEYKKLDANAGKMHKLMHVHVENLKKQWHDIRAASTIKPTF